MSTEATSSNAIQCSPKELQFKSLNKGEKQKTTLTLSNPTKSRFAFKVKTTCPKSYVVKPSVGFLEAESTFKITLIKQRNPKPSIVDKFLIEAMTTSEKRSNAADVQMRTGNNQEVILIKVPVHLEGPSVDTDSIKGANAAERDDPPVETSQPETSTTPAQLPPPPSPKPEPQPTIQEVEKIPKDVRPTTSARDGLIVMNSNLAFRFNATTAITSHIRLYNPSDDRLAFKVKNTFPKGFKVKPSQGFIKPRSSAEVEVLLLNCRGVDHSFSKFLIQSFVVDFSDEVITEAMYHKAKLYKAVRETELDVKLFGFEEEEANETVSVVGERNAAAAYEIRYLRKQLMTMENELQSLKRQVLDKSETPSRTKTPSSVKNNEGTACVGCMHAVPLFRTRKNRKTHRR